MRPTRRGRDVRRLPGGDWFVRGHVPVADLEDYGVELPGDNEAYNSVGGLVFNDLGRLPKRGDTSTSTATSCASSRCARTASCWSGSASASTVSAERERRGALSGP